jgi:hypothetical protein
MKKKIVNGHMTVTAGVGKFVSTTDRAVFGKTLSLGVNTTADDIIEDDEDNFPKCEDNEESPEKAQIEEI